MIYLHLGEYLHSNSISCILYCIWLTASDHNIIIGESCLPLSVRLIPVFILLEYDKWFYYWLLSIRLFNYPEMYQGCLYCIYQILTWINVRQCFSVLIPNYFHNVCFDFSFFPWDITYDFTQEFREDMFTSTKNHIKQVDSPLYKHLLMH